MTIIDHIPLAVSDLERSKHFYERAFAPLRYGISFGKKGIFWAFDVGDGLFEISAAMAQRPPLTRVHVAFRAKSKEEVDGFYRAALEAGAQDNGPPGPRRAYGGQYYACFVLDPDGYNIEAMINSPTGGVS